MNSIRIDAFRSFCRTKQLIRDYIDEVIVCLEYIAQATNTELPYQMKLDFFHETRQSFGCSALVLEGGATFGM
jgi:TAG lipase/lysophosphatidylethanolamine acyltransferase